MNDESEGTDKDRLKSLEEENKALRLKLKEQDFANEEVQAYRIYIEARKKLIGWAAGALVLLTIFGFYTWNDVVNAIKTELKAQGTDNIIEKIRDDFVKEHRSEIVDEIKVSLKPVLEESIRNDAVGLVPELVARVEDTIRTDLLQAEKKPVKVSKKGLTKGKPAADKKITSPYLEKKYFVIAGSSPKREDLVNERKRVKELVGEEFDKLFPKVEIYPPFGGNINYALVIGADLTYSKAIELKNLAVKMGFRKDAFLWNAENIYFDY